jgi:hypothetical protein
MLDLFLSEWRRFRRYTLFAAFTFAVTLLWGHFNDVHIFELKTDGQAMFAAMYIGITAAFAMVQLRSYQNPQRWLWLLHRPLPRPAIFGALALSAAAHIALVVGLPLLLAAIGTDLLTFRTVDLRHYLSIVFLVEVCIIAWLVVASVAFTGWTSIVVAILPCMLLVHRTTAVAAIVLAGAVLALYALIAYNNFKPDRKAPPTGLGANMVVAIPLMTGNFVVLMLFVALAFGINAKLAVKNRVSQKSATERAEAINGMESAKRMKYVVAKTDDPRRSDWQHELETAPVHPVFPTTVEFAKRQQLSNTYSPKPYLAPTRVLWSFDHDVMRFVGIDADTGQFREERGLHGKGDMTPFPAVPLAGHYYLVTPHTVHAFNFNHMNYPLRVVLQAPERVESEPKRIGPYLYMRSNQRLIAYHADRLSPDGLLVELFSIQLPAQVVTKVWIDVAPIEGSTLIMIGGNGNRNTDKPSSMSRLYVADRYGQVTLAKEYWHVIPNVDLLTPKQVAKIMSPVLNGAITAIYPLVSGQEPLQVWERAVNSSAGPAGWIALLLTILGCLVAWLWLRRGSTRLALGWVAACLLFGVPALVTLLLLHPRQRFVGKT